MAVRLPNPRKVKINRSYTVVEAARLTGVDRNTVRQWIKRGLPVCDDQRPLLILGADLKAFLIQKRTVNKRPCKPGEIYCVGCRRPQIPALNEADYIPLSAKAGNLVGICPACESLIYRRASLANLGPVSVGLNVKFTQAREDIVETCTPP